MGILLQLSGAQQRVGAVGPAPSSGDGKAIKMLIIPTVSSSCSPVQTPHPPSSPSHYPSSSRANEDSHTITIAL